MHPTSAAYRLIAESVEEDLRDEGARYTNPTRAVQLKKKPRYDPSLDREGWVSRCSAALSQRDTGQSVSTRGKSRPGVAGRRHIGASALTSVAAPREDLSAGPTGETDSGSSRVEGGEEAFKYVGKPLAC